LGPEVHSVVPSHACKKNGYCSREERKGKERKRALDMMPETVPA